MLYQVSTSVLLFAASSIATNTAGDPTDLSNWPACAQRCIPEGFGPPADCGSLSNLTCICIQGQFTAQIATCERLGCDAQEFTDIRTLSQALCAPVGGFGASLSSTIAAITSSTSTSLSVTPTIPPSATSAGAVSSVLATATLVPNLGNPADISTYPQCAQICNNETVAVAARSNVAIGDTSYLQAACDASFRGLTAGCEAATCSETDYTATQLLAQQLCGSLYASNATLSSSVSAAIASATAAAKAATDGKDPTQLSSLPACAANCITENNFGGCGSLSNLQCVCQGSGFNDAVGPCETANCSPEDLLATTFIAYKLCEPVGGVLTNPVNNSTGTTSNTTLAGSPTPVPFAGEGSRVGSGVGALLLGGVGVVVGLLML